MGGFATISGNPYGSVLNADNASFDGTSFGGVMNANGELWIGAASSPFVRKSTLTAGSGISITNGPGSITIAATGGGDVVGTPPTTTNAFARYTDATGLLIKNSIILCTDAGVVSGATQYLSGNGTAGAPTYSFSGTTNAGWYIAGGNPTISVGGTGRLAFLTSGILDNSGLTGTLQINYGVVGTAPAPLYTFRGDTNTGWFWVSADIQGWACGGNEIMRLTTTELSVTGGNLLVTTASAGTTRSATVINTNNSNVNSHAQVAITTGGGSGGNPFVSWGITGAQGYAMGIKNGSSDVLAISDSVAAPGTANDLLVMTPTTCQNTFGFSVASNTSSVEIQNLSATASKARLAATIGSTTGAAWVDVARSANRAFSFGVDANASDVLKISTNNSSSADPQTATVVAQCTTAGEWTYPLQPAFLAYVATTITDVTGDGTLYTVIFDTEVYDQNSDFTLASSTFTAPVTGRYEFLFQVVTQGGTVTTSAVMQIVTSNRTYRSYPTNAIGSTAVVCGLMSVIADMDAADTATFTITENDTGGKVVDVSGTTGGSLQTFVSGKLAC